MKIFLPQDHFLHAPKMMIDAGRLVPVLEVPDRIEVIRSALEKSGVGSLLPPENFGLDPVGRIHKYELIEFLATAYERWTVRYGPHAGPALPWTRPIGHMTAINDINAGLGLYCSDTLTPLTPDTYRAAQSSANAALSAASAVYQGERAAFALTRPPGHHASASMYGGYCYFNNIAIAAQWLVDRQVRPAILDVDYHHGNGTQEIFYCRNDIFFCSIHADPAEEYPYYSGYSSERGENMGENFTLNLPLPKGTTWSNYSATLSDATSAIHAFAPDILLVSLGLDTLSGDPEAFFCLTPSDFRLMGAAINKLKYPTVFCLEGGYNIPLLGEAAAKFLDGFLSEADIRD